MSIYSTFLADFKGTLADVGVPATIDGHLFLAMLSTPMTTPNFGSGGFTEQRMWTVRLAATTAAWTASDGRVGGAVASLSANAPVAFLALGKKLTVNGQVLRIKASAFKQSSAIISLDCIDDNQ